MRETQLIEQIRTLARAGYQNKEILFGIGDDCAIMRPRAAEDLVFTSDFVLEGKHFTLDTHRASDIGHKALARSLSDLAAMGSKPVFCLVSLALPARLGPVWIRRFYKGLLALASRYKITLIGGDLACFDTVVADVICCGCVGRGKAILRTGARPGDDIYVTGALGASAHGLVTRKGSAWRGHLRPEPRIATGLALQRIGVSACMDLSDGLSLDLHRLCLESKVSAELDRKLPIARGATLEQALHGGEDYELLFTAWSRAKVPQLINGVRITRIGKITQGRPGQIRFRGRSLKPDGFDHFHATQR